jgi:ABC-2 type transport system permease protein
MQDMPSKTSLFNKEIIIQSIKSVGWVGLVYLLGLLFALPLRILMIFTSERYYYHDIKNLFSVYFEIQIVLMMVIPVLLAIFLFRYLQVKPSTDMIHSFPIKRERLYNHHILMGTVFLTLPVVFTAFLVFVFTKTLDLEQTFSLVDIVHWTGATLVITLFLFLSSVFVGMFTGISAIQGVITYIVLIFPIGFYFLFMYNLKFFVYGFPYDYYLGANLEKFSPLIRTSSFKFDLMNVTEVLVYLFLSLVLYVLSMLVYKKRKLEAVSEAIAFRQLRPAFKYTVTFCFMLMGGMYFGEMEKNNLYWIFFGYAAGSMIGYFVAEMVLQKSWRVFKSFKGYIVYAGAAVFLLAIVLFDFTGYEKRVPDVRSIEQVYFGKNVHFYINKDTPRENSFALERKGGIRGIYDNPENISAIRNFHIKLVQDKNQMQAKNSSQDNAVFIYELKNGEKLIRQYRITDKDTYAAYYKPIYESLEYKKNHYQLLHVDPAAVEKITVSPEGRVDKRAVITNLEDIKKAIKALREDIVNQTYEDITDPRKPWAHIEFLLEDQRIHLQWEKSFTKFGKWLAADGKIENARISADDIDYALVIKQEDMKEAPYRTRRHEELIQKFKTRENVLKITDEARIEASLRDSSESWEHKGSYLIAFFYKNAVSEIRSFDEKYVPDFIKEHF